MAKGENIMSKGKQIILGVCTIFGISIMATLSLGNFHLIDTVEFWGEIPILIVLCSVLYFVVFVIYGVLAKRKNLELLAKTMLIIGAILAVSYLITFPAMALLDNYDNFLAKALSGFSVVIEMLIHPVLMISYPLTCSMIHGIRIFQNIMFFSAPIVGYIVYMVTARAGKGEKNEPTVEENQLATQ